MYERLNQPAKLAALDAIASALNVAQHGTRAEPGDAYSAWATYTLDTGTERAPCLVGISMHYNDDRKGDYITIGGSWPRDHKGNVITARDAEYGTASPEIRLSASKTPQVAANEIRRRLLPALVPLYVKAAAICAARSKYAHNVAANWTLLANAAGLDARKSDYHDGYSIPFLPSGVEIKYVGDDECRIELRLTIDEACDILRDRARAARAAEKAAA